MTLILPFLLTCISVKIPTGSGSVAKDVKYNAPTAPFEEIKNPSADKAWISRTTGNTISFLSDCGGSADPSLQQLENETLTVLNKLKVLDTKTFEFNGRDARSTVAEGEVDGVPVKTELLIFKKNGCNFTLSYGGIYKSFEAEQKDFRNFLQSFNAK
jgi:hypothetical protein